ncbi:YVTN family beta-propeller repeat protein [Kitasatospora sp. NPDC001664]
MPISAVLRRPAAALTALLLTAPLAAAATLAAPGTAHAAVGTGHLYVANSGTDDVSVVDTATGTVTATVPVGDAPRGVAAAPDGGRVYVADSGSDAVSVISTASNTVTATVPVGDGPNGLAVSPDGSRVYVADFNANTVSVIDTASNTVAVTVPVGSQPFNLAVTPDGSRVYVADSDSNTVSVIDTAGATVTATIPVAQFPEAVAVSPDGSKVYVGGYSSATLNTIDTATNTVVAALSVGAGTNAAVVSPDGGSLYLGSFNAAANLTVVDTSTQTVSGSLAAGKVRGVALDPSGATLYATDFPGDRVSVVDTATRTLTAVVPVGTDPYGLAFVRPQAPVPAPVVSGISPSSGPAAGGTVVTVDGTGLSGASSVKFGSTEASSFSVATDNRLTAVAPAGTGTVDVTVTTPGGSSATSAADRFTYTVVTDPGTPHSTALSAAPTLFSVGAGGLTVGLTLSATLTDTTAHLPAAGQTVRFTVGSATVCTAVTNAHGTATCSGLVPLLTVVLAGGYQATFAGTPALKPATARAGLIRLG